MGRGLQPAAVLCIFLTAGFSASAVSLEPSLAKVTDNTTVLVPDTAGTRQDSGMNYPALCRLAEQNGDWNSAWNFAEQWAASTDPAVRRQGVEKLLELSLRRMVRNPEKLLQQAQASGVSPENIALWNVGRQISGGDCAGAVKQLEPLIASPSLNRKQLIAGLKLLYAAQMGQKKFSEAADIARRREVIEDSPSAKFDALACRIYALSEAGRLPEARELLTTVQAGYPAFSETLADLQMLLDARSGNWKAFEKNFTERRGKGSGWYYAVCRAGAIHAETLSKPEEAIRYRRAALQAASGDFERKQAMLELLTLLDKNHRWEELAQVIAMYLEWYPECPERERLERRAAGCLFRAGKYPAGRQLYEEILARENISGGKRFETAVEAADQCAVHRMTAEELKFRRMAMRYARTAAERQSAGYQLGAYYDRHGKHQLALEAFRGAMQETGPLQEKAGFARLQTLQKVGMFAEALAAAEKLTLSKDPALRCAAFYYVAKLHEKTERPRLAADEYLEFVRKFPQSELAVPALYNAALIAEQLGDYGEAARRFRDFTARFPKNPLTPNAGYRLMLMLERSGKTDEAEKAAEALTAAFPESPFSAAVLFHLVDRAKLETRYAVALELLNRIENLPHPGAGILPRVLYDRAVIHAKLDNPRKALELLDRLLTVYAADPAAADAAELAGYLHCRQGEYFQAAACYGRAAQLRPAGQVAAAMLERQADVLYAAGTESRKQEWLQQAETIYTGLLKKGGHYASLGFKLGRCLEAEGKLRAAQKQFVEVLYRSAADQQNKIPPDRVWCSKSLYAAVRLCRLRNSLDGARQACRLLSLARTMGLEENGEYETLERDLQAKYKL